MPTYYFERALFIVGEQNSGKSTQLRSMFRDVRLGTSGIVPGRVPSDGVAVREQGACEARC
jgi:hypothetical protein